MIISSSDAPNRDCIKESTKLKNNADQKPDT